MNKMDDKLLYEVTGGSSRERTLRVSVELPAVDAQVKMTAYFDGELYYDQLLYASQVGRVVLPFRASCGKYAVKVNIDDVLYRLYELDFENASIRQIL